MSGQKNQVEQKITLNTKDYTGPLAQARLATRQFYNQVSQNLNDAGNRFNDYANQIKKSSGSLMSTLEETGKSFAKNFGRGALVGTVGGGAVMIKRQLDEAIATGLNFGRGIAMIGSKADLTKQKMKSLREELKALGKTGADLGSIPGALDELFGATGNIDKSMSVMKPIAQVAAMGDGDAAAVAKFVKDRLKGEGRDINPGSVNSVLQGLLLTQRGGEFKDFSEAMDGANGVDAGIKGRAGLSDRQYAALIAGATHAGQNKQTSMAGLQALIRASTDEISGNNILGGVLGIGSLQTRGQFDINKLGGASKSVMGFGKTDNQRIEVLGRVGGLSAQEAQGVFAFIKNFDAMKKGVDKTLNDQKTLKQAVDESTDNLSDALIRMRNGIVTGFDDITSPLEDVANDIVSGRFSQAMKKVPGAIGSSVAGVMDNKALVAGAIGITALSGVLSKKIGLFGGGAELAKGVGMGKALQQMGVTPVYVVNAADIAAGKSGGTALDKVREILGVGEKAGAAGAAGAAAEGAGVAGISAAGITTGGVAAVGALAAYGINNRIMDAAGKSGMDPNSVDAIGNLVRAIESMFGGGAQPQAPPVKIIIDTKDPQFMARPKATDLSRDGR